VQQDSSEQIGAVVPSQRTETTAPLRQPAVDETVELPAFLTGKKAREPKPPEPVRHQVTPDATLPASERGMLVFVAALLGVGTIAVVTVLGVGGLRHPHPHPVPLAAVASSRDSASVTPTTPPQPSPSPTVTSANPRPAATTSTASPRRSSPPTRVTLGTLTKADPAAFCAYNLAGRARPHEDGSWYCTGSGIRPTFAFTPNDVCQWRYVDKTAYAGVGDASDPATWNCYT